MSWIKLIFTYLPVVITTVKAIEEAASGNKVDKKQMVLDIITAGVQGAEQIPNEHVAGVGMLIDTVVGQFNKTGIFQKKSV